MVPKLRAVPFESGQDAAACLSELVGCFAGSKLVCWCVLVVELHERRLLRPITRLNKRARR